MPRSVDDILIDQVRRFHAEANFAVLISLRESFDHFQHISRPVLPCRRTK